MTFDITMVIVQTLFGIVLILAGFGAKRLWTEVDRTRVHVHELRNTVTAMALSSVERTVARGDLQALETQVWARFDALDVKLERLFDKLESKADKIR